MCGIPGSGKSTWVQNHKDFFSDDVRIVSRDQIRFSMLGENDEYFSKENEVWKEYVRQAKASLSNNVDTILDATHISEGSRSKILRALTNELKGVEINIIVIDICIAKAIEQNNLREGRSKVPAGTIRRMGLQFVTPTIEEGFDHIYIYSKVGDKVKYEIINKEGD